MQYAAFAPLRLALLVQFKKIELLIVISIERSLDCKIEENFRLPVKKAVIPAAGAGTRLLMATKEMPKEMLPVFSKGIDGDLLLKPALQVIFETLYTFGIVDFCLLVGRSKRAVEDHFTPDPNFVALLKGNHRLMDQLADFYDKVRRSNIMFVNQPYPKGFGDAVYSAKAFTSDEPFLVHAGDDIIIAKDSSHLRRLVSVFEETGADAVFLVERVADPSQYGVINGEEIRPGTYQVDGIMEKPQQPQSNLAIVGVYVFTKQIHRAIEKIRPDRSEEIQLTDAIGDLISGGRKVYAVRLQENEKRVDIGTPTSYWNALKETFAVSRQL
jgi:UTP--glucose-1-phosphate uridylyltransferase